jgi:hypothetical protein
LTVAFVTFPHHPDDALFVLSGPADRLLRLDRSTNAVDWIQGPVLQIDHSGTLLYLDHTPNSRLQQFFRATLRP